VTGRKLVAWQVDLRRRPRPVRNHHPEPRLLRLSRRTGSGFSDHPLDESGILELTFCPDAWVRHDPES